RYHWGGLKNRAADGSDPERLASGRAAARSLKGQQFVAVGADIYDSIGNRRGRIDRIPGSAGPQRRTFGCSAAVSVERVQQSVCGTDVATPPTTAGEEKSTRSPISPCHLSCSLLTLLELRTFSVRFRPVCWALMWKVGQSVR